MRILQISNKSPWPPAEGGPIAMNALITGLQNAGHVVHVLTMSTPKFPVDKESIPKEFKEKTAYRFVEVDNSVRAADAFKNLFTRESYNIARFISAEFENALKDCLAEEKYDAIILESLFVTPYISIIREYSAARIILRAHNIEHLIWSRMSKAAYNPVKWYYLHILARRLLQYEKSVIGIVDGIATITGKDAIFFRENNGATKVAVVPFGINPDDYVFTPQSGRNISLCHIGSMDWLPNREGIKWFIERCWPGIHKVFPDLKLFLAGRNMPDWLKNTRYPNIEIVGEVNDSQAFISNHPVMVVPLLSGSGVRVKIIEAMALGRTVIATSIGAEGIHCINGENILIADSPIAFYETIKTCIRNPMACACIGENARKLIETSHNIESAASAMLGLIETV